MRCRTVYSTTKLQSSTGRAVMPGNCDVDIVIGGWFSGEVIFGRVCSRDLRARTVFIVDPWISGCLALVF
jgi:hypothetical protein